MSDYQNIDVNPELVEEYIMSLAKYGASHETGVWRTVYSPEWVQATAQYAHWCEESGLQVKRDAVGNVWGLLPGSEGGKSIVSGSHIDSQTPGGRYDGALGALAGLIALRCLKKQFGQPKRTLEAIAFCEEESSRFPSANFWGSRAITGRIKPEDADNTLGFDGKTISEAMREVGLDPARIPEAKRDDIDTFIELHIEQGPILEQADIPVGIVTAVTGIRHYEVELRGTQNHAGAFPMDLRRDPMQGFAEIATGVVNTAHRLGRPAVTTVGRVNVQPNATAVIPDKVCFTVDARHPDPDAVKKLYATHENMMLEVAQRRNLDINWEIQINHKPCLSAPHLIKTLKESADFQQIKTMNMASGAGHDTQQMAAIADVAMVFVKSKDGRSHTPDEFSSIEDIVQGIKVLAGALYKLAW